MKHLFIFILIITGLTCSAAAPDSLKRRKHFAIEGDISIASAKINPIRSLIGHDVMARLKVPGFMCYNLAGVYNWRGFTRDDNDPVHEFSFGAGVSVMKMNIQQDMINFRHEGENYYSDVSFGTQQINFSYTPTELCGLFRYTFSTKKYFLSLNAGISVVLLDDTKSTVIQQRNDNTIYTSTGTTNQTVYSKFTVDHYLVPNNSINNILGIRCGYNGKKISPYFVLQRHRANTYSVLKFGIGAMLLL